MSKRHRDDGNAAVELDPNMLRDAQHKALTISLQRYKLSIDELEAKLQSTQRANLNLTDVVSLLGRQLVAVRPPPPHTWPCPLLLPPPPRAPLALRAARGYGRGPCPPQPASSPFFPPLPSHLPPPLSFSRHHSRAPAD